MCLAYSWERKNRIRGSSRAQCDGRDTARLTRGLKLCKGKLGKQCVQHSEYTRKIEFDEEPKISERGAGRRMAQWTSTHGSSLRTQVSVSSDHRNPGGGSRYLQPQGWVGRGAEGGDPQSSLASQSRFSGRT